VQIVACTRFLCTASPRSCAYSLRKPCFVFHISPPQQRHLSLERGHAREMRHRRVRAYMHAASDSNFHPTGIIPHTPFAQTKISNCRTSAYVYVRRACRTFSLMFIKPSKCRGTTPTGVGFAASHSLGLVDKDLTGQRYTMRLWTTAEAQARSNGNCRLIAITTPTPYSVARSILFAIKSE